jgi:hypothetical protein
MEPAACYNFSILAMGLEQSRVSNASLTTSSLLDLPFLSVFSLSFLRLQVSNERWIKAGYWNTQAIVTQRDCSLCLRKLAGFLLYTHAGVERGELKVERGRVAPKIFLLINLLRTWGGESLSVDD